MLEQTREKSAWKQGWRTVGGQRIYFRSRWEANYARYLETLVAAGEIVAWEHEPQTFWFPIRRGKVSYLPDFKIHLKDGSHEWHEVKGYMDPASWTKIKRLRKYHPAEILHVIGEPEYLAIEAKFAGRLPDWEWPDEVAPKASVDRRIRPGTRASTKARAVAPLERRLR